MNQLLGNKRLITVLLYCGSKDGWKFIDFHSKCDNKGPTISLFKLKDGDCIGGYTSAPWSSDAWPGKFVADEDAMLFNLSRRRHFPNKKTGTQIICSSDKGPRFIGGYMSELCAEYEPFNGEEKCFSSTNQPGYGISIDEEGCNMLTN